MRWILNFLNITSTKQAVLLIMLLACMGANCGCYYYKSAGHDHIATREKKFYRELRSSLNVDKYVIVHQGNNSWHLTNMYIYFPDKKNYSPNDTILYGSLEAVDSLSTFYYNKYKEENRRAPRYFVADEDHVLSQVHVYVGDDSPFYSESVSIPVSSIKRIEVYRQATGRTDWTWIGVNICVEILFSGGGNHRHHDTHNASPPKAQNAQYHPRRGK